MLEIKELVKNYGRFTAVDGLSLTVSDGSIFGFVGPNGAGKTTTMKIMSGLLKATSGRVIINNVDVIASPRTLRDKIGYMPDFFGVYDNLKVDEYMDFYAGTYYIPYAERANIINNLLDVVDLIDKKNEYVDSLSRGMKQRLCLARSLIHDPDVLILDEPASGLDPRARIEMKEILKQLKDIGKTIIVSSHILPELAEMCTEVGIIDRGKLKIQGSISDIMKKLVKKRAIYVKPLNNIENLLSMLNQFPEIENIDVNSNDLEFFFNGDDEALSRILSDIVKSDIQLLAFKEKEGNLEEIFMELTRKGAAL